MFPLVNDLPENSQDKVWRVALVLLSVFLFISPFPHTQTIGDICFYTSFLVALHFSCRGWMRFEKHVLWTALLLYGGWCLFSSVFALDPYHSFVAFYAHFIKYLFLTVMLIGFFGSRQGVVTLAWVVVVSGGIFSFVSMVYFYGVLGNDFSVRLGSGLARWPINPMGFVILFSLALVLPLYLDTKFQLLRILLIFLAGILGVAAILTQSRGTMIGLVLMLSISFWRYKKILAGGLLLVIVFAFSTTPVISRFAQEDKPRKALILYAIEVIKDHPVFGIGFSLDTFKDPKQIDPAKYVARIPESYRNVVPFLWPHNMFLDVAVRTGLVGVLLYSVFFGLMFVELFRLLRHASERFTLDCAVALLAALSMFLVKGVVEPVTMHSVEVVFYTILSMVLILIKLQNEAKKK